MAAQPSGNFEAFLTRFAREVIVSDVNAVRIQSELWQRFREHPDSLHPDPSLLEGWEPDRYLDVKTVTMTVHLRPLLPGFWKRLSLAWRFLRGKTRVYDFEGVPLELTGPGAPESIALTITYEKVNKESISITYTPESNTLKELFEQSPDLRQYV